MCTLPAICLKTERWKSPPNKVTHRELQLHLASRREERNYTEKMQKRVKNKERKMSGTESRAEQPLRTKKKLISIDSEECKPHWPNRRKGHKEARVNRKLIRCRQKTLMYGNMGADDSSMAPLTIPVRLAPWMCVPEMDGALGLPAP